MMASGESVQRFSQVGRLSVGRSAGKCPSMWAEHTKTVNCHLIIEA